MTEKESSWKKNEAIPSKRKWFVATTHEATELLLLDKGGSAIKVWHALALRANWKTGECWPSYKCIRKDHGFSHQFIANGVRRLVELGLLQKKRRFARSNCYFLKGYALFDASSSKAELQEFQTGITGVPNGNFNSSKSRTRELPLVELPPRNNTPGNDRHPPPEPPRQNSVGPKPMSGVVVEFMKGVRDGRQKSTNL